MLLELQDCRRNVVAERRELRVGVRASSRWQAEGKQQQNHKLVSEAGGWGDEGMEGP